jgi:O-acetyl-ADP-ribose deacetylase
MLEAIHEGNIVEQPVDGIVNAWNRNVLPWWILIPSGVAGAIRSTAGTAPFRELAKHGPMPLGSAVLTGAGRLPYRAIIHVAGIDLLWRASQSSISGSVMNALTLAAQQQLRSLAIPVIGAGAGGFSHARALEIVKAEVERHAYCGKVTIVTKA